MTRSTHILKNLKTLFFNKPSDTVVIDPDHRSKIRFLYDGINQQTKWYTGISIKRYIKKRIFSQYTQSGGVVNRSIVAGRWSAYCHGTAHDAFGNLLSKHILSERSHVIVHPLLPDELIEKLRDAQVQIHTLDINKATLAFDDQELGSLIRQLRSKNQTPDLIIHFDNTGLLADIAQSVRFASELYIPSIVVINHATINLEFFECINKLDLGGMMWLSRDSFIDEHITEVIDSTVINYSWYFSIHMEDRVRSIPEHHLRASHDVFNNIVRNYMILLAYKYNKYGFFDYAIWQFIRLNYLKKPLNIELVDAQLLADYATADAHAVPDFLFDLEERFPKIRYDTSSDLNNKTLDRQIKAKRLYDFFADYIVNHDDSQLEIPTLYLDRDYSRFTFYTTQKQYWLNYFNNLGISIDHVSDGKHSLVTDVLTPQAEFIVQYGLSIELDTVTDVLILQ